MRERDDRRPCRAVVAETSPDRSCGDAEGLDGVTDRRAGRVDPGQLRIEVVRDDGGLDAEPFGTAPGAAQPSPDGPLGNVEPLGDRAVPLPACVGQQRSADDLDDVPPPGQAPVGQQYRRRPASPAAGPSRPLPAVLSAERPKPSSSVAPRCQRGPTATQQSASGQRRLDGRCVEAHHHRHGQCLVPRVGSSRCRFRSGRGNSCWTMTARTDLAQPTLGWPGRDPLAPHQGLLPASSPMNTAPCSRSKAPTGAASPSLAARRVQPF